jgi:hypothetical protein
MKFGFEKVNGWRVLGISLSYFPQSHNELFLDIDLWKWYFRIIIRGRGENLVS